jgi:uncharacterized protein YgbK (DUF1537 family)
MSEVLQVIADDLTGACDIGAEFLALGGRVVVRDVGRRETDPAVAVSVCNTASRGCDVAVAVARVREAVRDLAPGWRGILVKKIDTALRGHVGAELAARSRRVRRGPSTRRARRRRGARARGRSCRRRRRDR